MHRGPQFKVSSDRLKKLGIKLVSHALQASEITSVPQRLLSNHCTWLHVNLKIDNCLYLEIPDFVKKGLKKFGFDSFRPGQEESVMRILCGK